MAKRNAKLWHQPNEPIPGEIEARLTKPKALDPVYQVLVDIMGKPGVSIPVLPMMNREAAEQACMAFNRASLDASKRQNGDWFNARPVQLTELTL